MLQFMFSIMIAPSSQPYMPVDPPHAVPVDHAHPSTYCGKPDTILSGLEAATFHIFRENEVIYE